MFCSATVEQVKIKILTLGLHDSNITEINISNNISRKYTVKFYNTRKLSYHKDDRAMRPIYGCPENFRESLSTPTVLFRKFLTGICSDRSSDCAYKNVALPVPEIIAIVVLGGLVAFERALVSSYRPSIHSDLSSIFTRFRDIAAFVLQEATFSHPLLLSPKFPHIPLGVDGWPLV